MGTMDEQILRTAKEIVVKFIETGRISPTTFRENFSAIYTAIQTAVKEQTAPAVPSEQPDKIT
jgi:hypothetical protein